MFTFVLLIIVLTKNEKNIIYNYNKKLKKQQQIDIIRQGKYRRNDNERSKMDKWAITSN